MPGQPLPSVVQHDPASDRADPLLDTVHRVETPEGIELDLRPAGPLPRMLAWMIDTLIRLGVLVVFGFALSGLERFGWGLTLILAFAVEWFYPTLFEVYRNGQTPGKRVLELRVIRDNGAPVDWPSSLIRNLLRVVDFLPMGYGFGLASMLINSDFKRLGDIGAGTLVVYADQPDRLPDRSGQAPVVPNQVLTLDEQRALIAYAERYPKLSAARAQELADLVGPLATHNGQADFNRLLGLANWLLGHR